MGRPREDISPALAARVAVSYYEDNKTHDEIGQLLGLSRWKVARILQHAKDAGIVRIQIHQPHPRRAELEKQLVDVTGLTRVIVVDSAADDSLDQVAQAAADHLAQLGPDLSTLAMSWGRTLTAVANALPHGWASGVDVVHVNGGMSILDTNESASWAVATVAEKASGRASVMPTPAIVQHVDTATALHADPMVSHVMMRAASADAVIFTVGVATSSSAHVTSGTLTADHVALLASHGAVGDVVGRFIDASGNIVDAELDARTLGLSLSRLGAIPERILVAATEDKASAVWGCIRRELPTTLVIDSQLADALLHLATLEKQHV